MSNGQFLLRVTTVASLASGLLAVPLFKAFTALSPLLVFGLSVFIAGLVFVLLVAVLSSLGL